MRRRVGRARRRRGCGGVSLATRFAHLPRERFGAIEVPVAVTSGSRLLGLSHLDRALAGPGLLIPRCRAVHTFGMRFPLDLLFLGSAGAVVAWVQAVPSRRFVAERAAEAVLEVPSGTLEVPWRGTRSASAAPMTPRTIRSRGR